MGNRWKGKISRTILNIFRPYNGIDVLKLPFLEELYEQTFVVPYVYLSMLSSMKGSFPVNVRIYFKCRRHNLLY